MSEKKVYDKLVRDRIPEIIADSGTRATFRIATPDEYVSYLEKKLEEEVSEYRESKDVEELVDIYEVVLALAKAHGGDTEPSFIDKSREKLMTHGGFSRRVILVDIEEETHDQT